MTLHIDEMSPAEFEPQLGIRERVACLLGEVGFLLGADGAVGIMRIHDDNHDVHGFYDLTKCGESRRDNSLTLHIQALIGMSDDEVLGFYGRFMEKRALAQIRSIGACAIGKEHTAIDYRLLQCGAPNFKIPWDPKAMKEIIDQGIAEL